MGRACERSRGGGPDLSGDERLLVVTQQARRSRPGRLMPSDRTVRRSRHRQHPSRTREGQVAVQAWPRYSPARVLARRGTLGVLGLQPDQNGSPPTPRPMSTAHAGHDGVQGSQVPPNFRRSGSSSVGAQLDAAQAGPANRSERSMRQVSCPPADASALIRGVVAGRPPGCWQGVAGSERAATRSTSRHASPSGSFRVLQSSPSSRRPP